MENEDAYHNIDDDGSGSEQKIFPSKRSKHQSVECKPFPAGLKVPRESEAVPGEHLSRIQETNLADQAEMNCTAF